MLQAPAPKLQHCFLQQRHDSQRRRPPCTHALPFVHSARESQHATTECLNSLTSPEAEASWPARGRTAHTRPQRNVSQSRWISPALMQHFYMSPLGDASPILAASCGQRQRSSAALHRAPCFLVCFLSTGLRGSATQCRHFVRRRPRPLHVLRAPAVGPPALLRSAAASRRRPHLLRLVQHLPQVCEALHRPLGRGLHRRRAAV